MEKIGRQELLDLLDELRSDPSEKVDEVLEKLLMLLIDGCDEGL